MKTFTVTLSGREREDGEAPFTWVVHALSDYAAVSKAKDIHVANQEEDYDVLELEEIFEGLPDDDCGYHWNDERDS
ncbi:hypothetical protein [Acrocarpospora sp. B8E8]|uniref:hypothetical protein n=1 Tax=Acrocarpospora sp. B8E8 TaxID=3153572 RepID=UPI00325D04F3